MEPKKALQSVRYWEAGASSVDALEGDGWFTFTIPAGNVGVGVGISAADETTDPSEPTHGFLFQNGACSIVESGEVVLSDVSFNSDTVFGIVRHRGNVFYSRGVRGGEYKRAPGLAQLPGDLLYASVVPSTGPVVLDASLLMPNDKVADAALHASQGGADVTFQPAQATARNASSGAVSISFRRMTASSSTHDTRVSIHFKPAQLQAAQNGGARALFQPAQVAASDESTGAVNTSFRRMVVSSSTHDTLVNIRFKPAQVQATLNGGVNTSFPPAQATAWSASAGAVNISFCQMVANGLAYGARVDMRLGAAQIHAAQDAISFARVVLGPATVTAKEGFAGASVRGAYLFLDEPVVAASGPGTSTDFASMAFAPVAVSAAQDARSEASLRFAPPLAFAFAIVDQFAQNAGPILTAVMPAFSGQLPATPGDTLDIESGAVMSDDVYPLSFLLIEDTMVVSSGATFSSTTVETVDEPMVMSVRMRLAGGFDLDDGVVMEGLAFAEMSGMAVGDVITMGADPLASSSTFALAESSMAMSGEALPFSLVDVEDGAAMAVDLVLAGTLDLTDDLLVGCDMLPSSATELGDALTDGMVISSEMDAWSSSNAVLESNMVASGQAFLLQPGLVAWVMNTDTAAVSWYDNWGFTSVATVGGRVFAAGPEGLHVLGGDLDGADPIHARVEFGCTEFGGYENDGQPTPSHYKKRVAALWLGYHADNVLTATVETYGGEYPPQSYTMPARSAEQPRNNRITPGRGLNARYWRISINNNDGGGFEVHSITAETATSTRRL